MLVKLLTLPLALIPWRALLLIALAGGAGWIYLDDISGVSVEDFHPQQFPITKTIQTDGATAISNEPGVPIQWRQQLNSLCIWLLFTAILPFLLLPLTLKILRDQTNGSNALLLTGYTLITGSTGTVLLWPLAEFAGAPMLIILVTLISMGVHYHVCGFIEHLWME